MQDDVTSSSRDAALISESNPAESAAKWREMKLCTPPVVWHAKDPVYSVDFHCLAGSEWRLASAGTDKDVKIWKIIKQDGKIKLEFMSQLTRHCKPVNVVRFSPNGSMLASGSDDATICVWERCKDGTPGSTAFGEEDVANRETWSVTKTLRGHLEDVYDLCWSPDSAQLLSCSFDESVILWDVAKGTKVKIFRDSKQPSQGVCWDPLGRTFAILSRDRCLRVYSAQSLKLLQTTSKLSLPAASSTSGSGGGGGGGGSSQKVKMYHDEGLRSFFRRPAFTPDGSLLITPAGYISCEDVKQCNTTYVYSRECYDRPLLHLPVSMPTVAVRTCPVLFELRKTQQIEAVPLVILPYSMVFAVASVNSVYLYSTQQLSPISYVSNIHYANLTDLTWSADGLTLVISSSDGYCSFVTFQEGELGTPLHRDKLPELLQPSPSPCCAQMDVSPAPKDKGMQLSPSGPRGGGFGEVSRVDRPPRAGNSAAELELLRAQSGSGVRGSMSGNPSPKECKSGAQLLPVPAASGKGSDLTGSRRMDQGVPSSDSNCLSGSLEAEAGSNQIVCESGPFSDRLNQTAAESCMQEVCGSIPTTGGSKSELDEASPMDHQDSSALGRLTLQDSSSPSSLRQEVEASSGCSTAVVKAYEPAQTNQPSAVVSANQILPAPAVNQTGTLLEAAQSGSIDEVQSTPVPVGVEGNPRARLEGRNGSDWSDNVGATTNGRAEPEPTNRSAGSTAGPTSGGPNSSAVLARTPSELCSNRTESTVKNAQAQKPRRVNFVTLGDRRCPPKLPLATAGGVPLSNESKENELPAAGNPP